ncbi:hypothetical protein PIB30_086392 [Stylosanthes scabra]|uniref:F-box associated domain-containing protein n=1 Tax=Stylosanthes scabra TaxID=79078 RepID=A0ABU6YQN7_9FABA|nr:hypothetical protein [Stylosanthes scabra]
MLMLFYNGAIHWLSHVGNASGTIIVFDASQRIFWEIPVPEEAARKCNGGNLRELGGCLAFYYEKDNAEPGTGTSVTIWVMREYNVHSSWTSYEIPTGYFEPFWLSENGDFIGFDNFPGMATYNVNGELLHRFDGSLHRYSYVPCAVYTESLLSLPNDGSEEKQGS